MTKVYVWCDKTKTPVPAAERQHPLVALGESIALRQMLEDAMKRKKERIEIIEQYHALRLNRPRHQPGDFGKRIKWPTSV